MKYLPIRDIDILSNALNFSTPDCHIIGGCDLYTTKAAGGDKKLYKNIETSLESQYESLVRLSASLSPPLSTFSEDGHNNLSSSRKRSRSTVEPEIDLSRSSPFGPLSQISSRRTFAYLIATLNASHPDYDFSHLLRPSDFTKERSLRGLQHTVDSTLANLRPRQTAAMSAAPPPPPSTSYSSSHGGGGGPSPSSYSYSSSSSHHLSSPHAGAPYLSGLGSEVWTPHMWRLLDGQMSLRACEKYRWSPDAGPATDPFEADDGALWSMHYFFFNKDRKRVAYLYLRAFSVISHSPVNPPLGAVGSEARTRRTRDGVPVMGGGGGAGGGGGGVKRAKISAADGGPTAGKRASYWLGSDAVRGGALVETDGGDDGEDDDDDEMVAVLSPDCYYDDADDEVEVPFMNLDDIRSEIVDGRLSYGYDDYGGEDGEEGDGGEDEFDEERFDGGGWAVKAAGARDGAVGGGIGGVSKGRARHVRGISEEIGDSMDMDE